MKIALKSTGQIKDDIRDINASLGTKFNLSQLTKKTADAPESLENADMFVDIMRSIRAQEGTPYRDYAHLVKHTAKEQKKIRAEKRISLPEYFESNTQKPEKTPRLYQEYIIKKLLQTDENFGVELPTGTGKTLIEFLVLREYARTHPDTILVLTAPTGILCAQHRQELPHDLQDICFDPALSPYENIAQGKRLWVDTPESFEMALEKNILDHQNISIGIMDEVHIGTKADTGKYSTFPLGEKINQSGGRILGFTASPGGESGKKVLSERLGIKDQNWLSWQTPEVWDSLQYYYQPKYIQTISVSCPEYHTDLIDAFGDILEPYWQKIKDAHLPYIPKNPRQRIPYIPHKDIEKILTCLNAFLKNEPLPEHVQTSSWDDFLRYNGYDYEYYKELKEALHKYGSYYDHYQQIIGESYQGFLDQMDAIQDDFTPHQLKQLFPEYRHPHPIKTPDLMRQRFEEIESTPHDQINVQKIYWSFSRMIAQIDLLLKILQTQTRGIILSQTLKKYTEHLQKIQETLHKHIKTRPNPKDEDALFEWITKLKEKTPWLVEQTQTAIEILHKNEEKSQKNRDSNGYWYKYNTFFGDDLKNIYKTVLQLRQKGIHHPKIDAYREVIDNEINKRDNQVMSALSHITVLQEAQRDLKANNFDPISIRGGAGKFNEIKHAYAKKKFEAHEKNPLQGTSVLRQGIDTSADTMVHYSLPRNEEERIQYGGRAGRQDIGRNIYLAMDHPESRDRAHIHRITQGLKKSTVTNAPPTDPLYKKLTKSYDWSKAFGGPQKKEFWIDELDDRHHQEINHQGKNDAPIDQQEKISVLVFERFKVSPPLTIRHTSNGWYLTGNIQDKTGSIPLRIWGIVNQKKAEELRESLQRQPFVGIAGNINKYRGQIQCNINLNERPGTENNRIIPLSQESFIPEEYGEKISEKHLGKEQIFIDRYKNTVENIDSESLKTLLETFFKDNPTHWTTYRNIGAGSRNHHSYPQGLIEHSTNLATIGRHIAKLYPWLKSDVIQTGALLHDIGKTKTYTQNTDGHTQVGDNEIHGDGHLNAGLTMIMNHIEQNIPKTLSAEEEALVYNCILGHQGRPKDNMGGIDEIKYPETLAVFFADFLESKLNTLLQKTHQLKNTDGEYPSIHPTDIWYQFQQRNMEYLSDIPALQSYLSALREIHYDLGDIDPQTHKILELFQTIKNLYPSLKTDIFIAITLTNDRLFRLENPFHLPQSTNALKKLNELLSRNTTLPHSIQKALRNAVANAETPHTFSEKLPQSSTPEKSPINHYTLLYTHLKKIVQTFDALEEIRKGKTIENITHTYKNDIDLVLDTPDLDKFKPDTGQMSLF